MTYKEKMEKEHPTVDSNFVLFACPGHFLDKAPIADRGGLCPRECGNEMSCFNCWSQKIPEPKPESVEAIGPIGLDVKRIAARVKALYCALRDEDLNDREAFEITKIIIKEEIRSGLVIESNKNRKEQTDG